MAQLIFNRKISKLSWGTGRLTKSNTEPVIKGLLWISKVHNLVWKVSSLTLSSSTLFPFRSYYKIPWVSVHVMTVVLIWRPSWVGPTVNWWIVRNMSKETSAPTIGAENTSKTYFSSTIHSCLPQPDSGFPFLLVWRVKHFRYNASDRVISSSQTRLPTQHAINKTDEHPSSQQDAEQSGGHRLTSETARPPEVGGLFLQLSKIKACVL